MEDLIQTFHIDWKLMLAQIFNFALVFLVLYFLAVKPLRKVITERTEEITTGLDNAKQSKEELENAEKTRKEIEKEARMKANDIVNGATEEGKKVIKELTEVGAKEKEQILQSGKNQVELEREEMVQALSKETAHAVILSVEKVLKSSMTPEKGDTLIKEILAKNK